jgi:TonB family protein
VALMKQRFSHFPDNLGSMRTLALWLTAAAVPLCAQDWTPKRIVAITEYAPLPRQARIQGDVEVRCFLDANGTVTRAEVINRASAIKGSGATERSVMEVSANRAVQ